MTTIVVKSTLRSCGDELTIEVPVLPGRYLGDKADDPAPDAHLDGPASGWTTVDVTSPYFGMDFARPERYRPEQVQARGRWRSRKQVLRRFAAELGWPECMEVAHDEQIVGAVLQAGLRLRDWRRFERSGRGRRKYERELRAAQERRRKSLRQSFSSGDPPF